MSGPKWEPFATLVRGPAREIFSAGRAKKDVEADVEAYDVDADTKSEVVFVEVAATELGLEKRETPLEGLERTRALLFAVYGEERAKAMLEGKAD